MSPRRAVPALALALLAFAGCSDEATRPKVPNLTGRWVGAFPISITENATFDLMLAESGQSLSGNGTFFTGTLSAALTVTGTHAHPSVSLTMASAGVNSFEFNFTGTAAERSMTGTLTGSGFSGAALTLTKQ